MNYLIDPLVEMDEYRKILSSVKSYDMPVEITGPSNSQKAHISAAICAHLGCRSLYVTYNELQARKMFEDFSFFFGDEVLFFPSKEITLHDVEAKNYDAVFQRLRVLDMLAEGRYKVIVTSAEAVCHKLVSKELFMKNSINLKTGGKADLESISKRLVEMGYERVSTVEGYGQFAIRGGILDVFSVNNDFAARIEMFGDEIDSIRSFDTISQRSMDMMDSVRIIPAREVIYTTGELERITGLIEKEELEHIKKIDRKVDARYIRQFKEKISLDIERLKEDLYFPGIDRYIAYILSEPKDITDYIDDNTVVFIDESIRFKQHVERMGEELKETLKILIERGRILPRSGDVLFDNETLIRGFEKKRAVYINTLLTAENASQKRKIYSLASRQGGVYQRHIDLLAEDISQWKRKKNRVVVLSGTRDKGEKLAEELREREIEAAYFDEPPSPLLPGSVTITRGSLSSGFEYPSIGLVVISDREVFGHERKRRKVSARKMEGGINLFADLSPGDYVVHQVHGIGQYIGMEKLEISGIARDYVKIKYLENDFLYIPTNQMDLVQKYIGTEGKAPKLHKLGGAEWAKTKKRVKESLKDIAAELVNLYAKRQSMKGFKFSKDTVWQKQFEETFPFEETEDQLKCIEEVKEDMESNKPMDRLLCGDVGYGKTEVAVRAIFKAIMDGKQVAYLVPTTILAQQHYNNFKERFKEFPVTIEMISRFRTKAQQRKILKDLKAGNIDVLIGTHRLLQKDIQFKDLGLLVVDEEQRFGVEHKERIKNIKPNVDVLTLTATPIPRTLHMSLVGILDISVIEDPPEDRYPIQTYVMEYDREVVRDAIIRELSRKGQVFYLFNRVRSIDLKASEIQTMVPEARVAVAHGQMEERYLEDIMIGFLNREFDILVCTTIIESGLDMPNVNTIIVEDADKMGLTQLYQLRGRVGRSDKLAYAYITYRKDKVLSEIAEKRLQAIKEFTELGSGFKIAMRDLEIRGAGNILGPEQHGHMEAVGYDMYCRLLEQAIKELKGEETEQAEIDTSVDLKVSAYIDDEYINVSSQKLEMYKKIASIQDEHDAADIEDELIDRFGDLPEPVRNLILIAQIKALARNAGFSSVTQKDDRVIFQAADGKRLNIEAISSLASKYRKQIMLNAGSSPYLIYETSGKDEGKILENIKILLQHIKNFEDN